MSQLVFKFPFKKKYYAVICNHVIQYQRNTGFFLDKIFGVLVLKSNFSPAIASWGILLIFLTIALILLRKAIR